MPITFLPFVGSVEGDGATNGIVSIGGGSYATALAAGEGHTSGFLTVSMTAILLTTGGVFTEVPPNTFGTVFASVTAVNNSNTGGDTEGDIPLFGAAYYDTATEGSVAVSGSASSSFTFGADYAFLVPQLAVIVSYAGVSFENVQEQLWLGVDDADYITSVIRTRLGIGDESSSFSDATRTAADNLVFDDQVAAVLMLLTQEGIVFGETLTATPQAVERVVNQLLLSGLVSSYADAVSAITIAMVFGSLAQALSLESATDNMTTSAAVLEMLTAAEQAIESLLFAPVDSSFITAMVLVNESLLADDVAVSTGEFASLISESLGFVTHLTLDSGDYVAWVLNTESRGVSTYSNYPFNSFAKVGGAYYGATSAGLFALEGDSDDGVPIVAKLRLGLSDMGSRKLKRLPEAYIGYTSNGTLLLRVITVDDFSGDKIACVYKLAPRGATNIRENRFQIGRGIKAVDWDFEIENVDGADFDLTSVEFNPLIMDRRTRG